MVPWWISLGYVADRNTWLPGDQSVYLLYNAAAEAPDANMHDVDRYATEAQNILGRLETVIVGLTRDWKQQGQIWRWDCVSMSMKYTKSI